MIGSAYDTPKTIMKYKLIKTARFHHQQKTK